jgi:SPP1 gp7 family putative phage head morphogenesis protein
MCGTSGTDDLAMIVVAREAADAMLGALRVSIAKALDLSTPRGFDTAVARLGAELRRHATAPETEAVRRALAILDVDWRATTPAQRSAVVRRALAVAGRLSASVPARIEAPLGRAATAVVRATRSDVRRRQRLAIAADLNAVDHRAVAYISRANALFVRDEYGRRVQSFGEHARRIVARGLEQGLGRNDIAEDLAEAADASLIARARPYWDVVAASFIGEGRSLSQISGYAEAGIDRYVLLAVLDEHTTDTCRFLDGKVLQTQDALRTFDRLEASDDPLVIKRERPWVRERTGDDGKRHLVVDRDDADTVLAIVERSGVGARDDRGAYSRALSGRELAPAGIGFPPFHGFCRTTTVPDV